jgi:hypothetical protein
MASGIFHRPQWLVLVALVSASSVWWFARIVVSQQVADAASHDRPRGNLSDLYPRWLGARELLLHGRDPYSPDVTREIQQGFYGRVLDPARPEDPKDQEAFAYPPYVVFLLAPTIHLPFEVVRKGFFWVLLGLTAITIPLWLRVLRWRVPWWAQASIVICTAGSLQVMQAIKLQQITLVVVALLAAALALLVSDRPIAAGILLACATIKPQHVWLLLLWLTIWTLADWRHRYRWVGAFLLTMAVLFAASEWYLPHWIPRFLQAVREYRNYTGAVSVMDKLVPSPWGWLVRILVFLGTAQFCWKNRSFAADTPAFASTTALVLAVTVIITVIPAYALYNQALLLPAVLILVRERYRLWHSHRMSRILFGLVAGLLAWPWVASIVLSGLSLVMPRELVERAWAVPFWSVLPLPLAVVGMLLIANYQKPFAAHRAPATS